MARCKKQAQKCRFSEAEIEDRPIEQLIIGTREPKGKEASLGKDDKLKRDKAMNIARKREATVNDMKSLEQRETFSTCQIRHGALMLSIKTFNVENVGLNMEKMSSPRHEMQEM